MKWKPIETLPGNIGRTMFVVIAIDVRFDHGSPLIYTSDPWCVWATRSTSDLTKIDFNRWPHNFQPTHWHPLPTQYEVEKIKE